MPRTKSAPKPLAKARPATARLPRVASQGKAPVHSRAVATPRVRKNSLECGSVFDVAPRLTRQRTGETAADSPEPPTVASPPPPTAASPLPDRRSGLSDEMGAVSVSSPLATVAVAPRALRPPLAPFSLEPPKTRGAPDQPPARRPAATPTVTALAPASAPEAHPRRMSARPPLAEAGRPTRLDGLRAKAAAEAAAEEEAEATAAAGGAPTAEPMLGLRRKAGPGTHSGGSPLRPGFRSPSSRPPRCPPLAEAGGSPRRPGGLHAGRETSSRPRVRAWHEAATAAARFVLVLPSAVRRAEVAAKAVGGAPPGDTAESPGGGGGVGGGGDGGGGGAGSGGGGGSSGSSGGGGGGGGGGSGGGGGGLGRVGRESGDSGCGGGSGDAPGTDGNAPTPTEICRDEVELLLRAPVDGPLASRAAALGRVRAALRLDDTLDAAAARLGVHKGALLKSLLEAPPYTVGGGGGGGGGGDGGAAAEPSVEPLAEGRCGMEAAEWCEMQAKVLETVEGGTYAHKVLRYKYQDVVDMRMARQMLQRCEAFLAGEVAPVPVPV